MENNEEVKIDTDYVKVEGQMDLTIVLPIKTMSTKRFDELFEAAIKSIKNQLVSCTELVIVHTDETALVEFLKSYDFSNLKVRFLEWVNEPNFAEQVNYGVSQAETKWVSILEFDDEYSSIWFKNAKKYSEIFSDVDIFLPIVVDIDDKGVFAGFTNEATFAANFSQEIGILTNETLQQYQNFQSSGMVFKKSLFEKFGGIKSNIKLTFIYEMFLRYTQNSVKIMTIPRIGYKHANMREGSIFWQHKFGTEKLSENEVKFWIQTAKQEYFFTEERAINYEQSN
jgi:hypothetical protein